MNIFIGRLCPVHLGHEAIIKNMEEEGGESLIILGSAGHPWSLRHFFSYEERRRLLTKIFPSVRVAGLPDFPTDAEWLLALDDIISLASNSKKPPSVFYGGCEEDVAFFLEAGRNVKLINRFDGTTPKVSATEVRDALIHERPLDGLINPLIQEDVSKMFSRKWEAFRKT